jgi:uncharacterized membrane protein YjfL (UPF0719 family)
MKKAALVDEDVDEEVWQALDGAFSAAEEADEASRKQEYKECKQATKLQGVDWDIRQAVVFIRDSQQGRSRASNLSGRTWRIYNIYHTRYYRLLYAAVVVALLGLAEFEEPSTFHHFRSRPGVLAWGMTALVELLLVFLVFGDVYLKLQKVGLKVFRRNPFNWLKAFVVVLSVLNIVVEFVVSAASGGKARFPRFQRVLRPLLLIAHFRNVQKVFLAMMRAMKNICRVGLLLLLEICFFSVFAFVFFEHTSFASYNPNSDMRYGNDAECRSSAEQTTFLGCSTWSQDCTDYFSTLEESIHKLFIVTTTANFPDVMLPVYSCQ